MWDRLALIVEETVLADQASDLAARKAKAPPARPGWVLDMLQRLTR